MILQLLIIQIIIVNLVDLSGFVDTVKHWLYGWLWKGRPYRDFEFKPWSCDYCMTHHIGLIYLLITGQLTLLTYMLLLILSYIAPITRDILILIKDTLIKIIDLIYKILHL